MIANKINNSENTQNYSQNNPFRISAGIFTAIFTASLLTGCGNTAKIPSLDAAVKKTAEYEQKTIPSPTSDSLGGEWAVIPLARSGEKAGENYFEKYRANLEKRVKEQGGALSENRYTEYARAVLGVKAIGGDPTDIGGFDIQKPLDDYDAVTSQGLNGAVFALMALNADRTDVNGNAELQYLTYIREQEKPAGGFSLNEETDQADVDITAMTLQSLEPYQEEAEIKEIIDRGIEFLADAQDEEGGYLAYGDKSSESVSQVIITLSTYGIDCNKDQRFLKNGKGLYDTLMEYYQKDGSFSHLLEADADPMATDQAFCALVAYQRFQQGKSSFYNMSE